MFVVRYSVTVHTIPARQRVLGFPGFAKQPQSVGQVRGLAMASDSYLPFVVTTAITCAVPDVRVRVTGFT
jgi:hypothetical protein